MGKNQRNVWSTCRVYSDTRSKKGMLLYHLLSRNYNTWRCCCLLLVVVLTVLFLLESISASGTKTTVMFMSPMKPMKIHSAVEKCHGLDQLMQTAFDCLSARCVLPWLWALRVRYLSSGDFKEQIRDFRKKWLLDPVSSVGQKHNSDVVVHAWMCKQELCAEGIVNLKAGPTCQYCVCKQPVYAWLKWTNHVSQILLFWQRSLCLWSSSETLPGQGESNPARQVDRSDFDFEILLILLANIQQAALSIGPKILVDSVTS